VCLCDEQVAVPVVSQLVLVVGNGALQLWQRRPKELVVDSTIDLDVSVLATVASIDIAADGQSVYTEGCCLWTWLLIVLLPLQAIFRSQSHVIGHGTIRQSPP
jgi:hypothetical protein